MMLMLVEVERILNYIKGISLDKLGRTDEAIIDYSKAIEINPHFSDAYYYRGNYSFK